ENWWASVGIALAFLIATTVLLVMDLDQPNRFLYVIMRPQWKSWLVRGGYALSIFGGFVTLWGIINLIPQSHVMPINHPHNSFLHFLETEFIAQLLFILVVLFAAFTAIY